MGATPKMWLSVAATAMVSAVGSSRTARRLSAGIKQRQAQGELCLALGAYFDAHTPQRNATNNDVAARPAPSVQVHEDPYTIHDGHSVTLVCSCDASGTTVCFAGTPTYSQVTAASEALLAHTLGGH